MYITYNLVSIPTQWAVAGPYGQLASHLLYMTACPGYVDIQIYSCEYIRGRRSKIFHAEFPCNLHARGSSRILHGHSLSHY